MQYSTIFSCSHPPFRWYLYAGGGGVLLPLPLKKKKKKYLGNVEKQLKTINIRNTPVILYFSHFHLFGKQLFAGLTSSMFDF